MTLITIKCVQCGKTKEIDPDKRARMFTRCVDCEMPMLEQKENGEISK